MIVRMIAHTRQLACRWLKEHMPKTYHATVDADMKTDLNWRFIHLKGGDEGTFRTSTSYVSDTIQRQGHQ
jgi:hypothetical protein